jgi:hypothetical protein
MAEIDIERKPRRSWWPWALAALLLLLVVGTTWYLAGPEGEYTRPDTDAPGTYEPQAQPTPDEPGAPGTGPRQGGP